MKLTFLGAAETVTGSKYLLDTGTARVLVDCGLFQGTKNLRLRNWAAPATASEKLDAVVLTHAHIDHSGYLPVLARYGYRGPVYCTDGTRELCAILLRDAAKLQEEEAEYANRHGYSRHHPALPLYTSDDAEHALELLVPCPFDTDLEPVGDLQMRFVPSGHILGAASVVLRAGQRGIAFSGDVGRPHDPIMRPPQPLDGADTLLIESTYGNRVHPNVQPDGTLAKILSDTFRRGGTVIIPAFAVGRTQTILYYIAQLKATGRMAPVPVYLDSPMATAVTELYLKHAREHRLDSEHTRALDDAAVAIRTVDESKWVTSRRGPMVVIAGSGMATGGRVLHHLKAFAPDARNTILLVGYQAAGTRGAALEAHEPTIKIHGEYVPVRAKVESIATLSSHADSRELLAWLRSFPRVPPRVFVTHGEPDAADALRRQIADAFHVDVSVPSYLESAEL